MIKILHLYYDLLNLYGEQGNILALTTLINNQNVPYEVDYKTIKDKIEFKKYDIVYLGSGSNENLLIALEDIKKYKKQLKKYIDDGNHLIATGNSYLLFGSKIDELEALNLFDYYSVKNDKITGECFMEFDNLKTIIGFQNRHYIVKNISNHLFKVKKGFSDDLQNEYEGIKYNNYYGTFTFGPLLIRNPHLTEKIIKEIFKKKNFIYHETENYLNKAYEIYIKNFYENS